MAKLGSERKAYAYTKVTMRERRWWKCPRCSNVFSTNECGQWCAGTDTTHILSLVTEPVPDRFVTTSDGWQGTYDNRIEAL
jgi:hypothetical protein